VAVRRGLVKVAIAVVALGVLGVLFVRSAQNVRAEPYEVPRDRLQHWTLVAGDEQNGSGVRLALRPPREFASTLFSQVFARSGESMSGPVPAEMPLVLQREFGGPTATSLSDAALLALARESGLESPSPQPACMAHRRISAPGITRQLYFVVFDLPAYRDFRQALALRLRQTGTSFDAAALSPAVIIAASDAQFSGWQPLRADPGTDCIAPIQLR
jgi:hypothetical protein